jgi:hypothetical protein
MGKRAAPVAKAEPKARLPRLTAAAKKAAKKAADDEHFEGESATLAEALAAEDAEVPPAAAGGPSAAARPGKAIGPGKATVKKEPGLELAKVPNSESKKMWSKLNYLACKGDSTVLDAYKAKTMEGYGLHNM